ILISKEKVSIPPDLAGVMTEIDTTMGEFRIHYAGFFDPGFGYDLEQGKGTRAVLEARSHDVPFVIEDGQMVGRLSMSASWSRRKRSMAPASDRPIRRR